MSPPNYVTDGAALDRNGNNTKAQKERPEANSVAVGRTGGCVTTRRAGLYAVSPCVALVASRSGPIARAHETVNNLCVLAGFAHFIMHAVAWKRKRSNSPRKNENRSEHAPTDGVKAAREDARRKELDGEKGSARAGAEGMMLRVKGERAKQQQKIWFISTKQRRNYNKRQVKRNIGLRNNRMRLGHEKPALFS